MHWMTRAGLGMFADQIVRLLASVARSSQSPELGISAFMQTTDLLACFPLPDPDILLVQGPPASYHYWVPGPRPDRPTAMDKVRSSRRNPLVPSL